MKVLSRIPSVLEPFRGAFRKWIEEPVDRQYKEKILAIPTKLNEYGYDPFGYSPEFTKWAVLVTAWFYKYWFRVELNGAANVPEGRVLLISNHSGQIPLDGVMIATGLFLEPDPPRAVRSMIERWVPTLPYVSIFMARVGQVLGSPENARRLLKNGEALLVFPEGVRGINKTWYERYHLKEFGLGFMRLALETETPIVPIGVVGAEEQIPTFVNFKALAKFLGMPAFPITPFFPWLGPLGMFPLPVKYHIYFGEPMYFTGDPNDEDIVIERKVREVRAQIRSMLTYGLRARNGIFW